MHVLTYLGTPIAAAERRLSMEMAGYTADQQADMDIRSRRSVDPDIKVLT